MPLFSGPNRVSCCLDESMYSTCYCRACSCPRSAVFRVPPSTGSPSSWLRLARRATSRPATSSNPSAQKKTSRALKAAPNAPGGSKATPILRPPARPLSNGSNPTTRMGSLPTPDLYFVHYNFRRMPKSLRTSPMATGVATRCETWICRPDRLRAPRSPVLPLPTGSERL